MTGPRVAIVGAGPAGTRAAEVLVRHSLRPVVIDEAPRSGGQIYRRPPEAAGFTRPAAALYGFEAAKARRLHATFDGLLSQIDYRPEALVWNIADRTAYLWRAGRTEAVSFDALVLATGAMDRVIPLPGWTRPGVFTLGGAQVALKHQGCVIGRRAAFLGTGPLLYLVAAQYARAGAEVAAVLDTAPPEAGRRAVPQLLNAAGTFGKGLFYLAELWARRIPVETGVRPLAVLGGEDIVTGLRYRTAIGAEREIACDAVGLGYGLKPESQLADLVGCAFRFDRVTRQWLPETDAEGRAVGVPGVYLAGDGAAIAGADSAELAGERAALALLADFGRPWPALRGREIARRMERLARFRAGLEAAFPFPAEIAQAIPNSTILCRCESVTAGELRRAAREFGATEINRAKAFSRVGMGRCQGRICGPAAAEILAATLGADIESVGRLRGQPPVKPLPAGALAAAPAAGTERT